MAKCGKFCNAPNAEGPALYSRVAKILCKGLKFLLFRAGHFFFPEGRGVDGPRAAGTTRLLHRSEPVQEHPAQRRPITARCQKSPETSQLGPAADLHDKNSKSMLHAPIPPLRRPACITDSGERLLKLTCKGECSFTAGVLAGLMILCYQLD